MIFNDLPHLRQPDSEDTSQRIDIRREVIGKPRILNAPTGEDGPMEKLTAFGTQVAPQIL